MARLRQYLNFLNAWEEVEAAVELYAAEMPQLELMRPQLQELLAQARSLVVQVNEHTAAKQELNKTLRQVIAKGQTLVFFIRTGARQHFGKDSELLVKFGLQPFRGLNREKKEKPPETAGPKPPEAPTSTPTSETAK